MQNESANTPISIDAREKLNKELWHYIDDNTTGSGCIGIWPAINPGHPVHSAVVALEQFYPEKKLPPDGRMLWIKLVQESRNAESGRAGKESDPVRNSQLTSQAGMAAAFLMGWVSDSIKSITDTATPKPARLKIEFRGENAVASLDLEQYPLTSQQGKVLQKLLDAQGAYVPSAELKTSNKPEERPDRIVERMPGPIGKLIQSQRGHGGGFRLTLQVE